MHPKNFSRPYSFKERQEEKKWAKACCLLATRMLLCFSIFGKNSKIQNGRHFWGGENFLKIANSTFLLYPVGRKFRRNCSISHG